MDATINPNLNLSSFALENEFPDTGRDATFDSLPVTDGYTDIGNWPDAWHQNGFYIGNCSSSELSLPQGLTSARSGSVAGSDVSWTEEDDTGTTFFEIPQMLQAFVLARDETSLIIPALTSQQRRVVHGMAHLMHLGHTSYKAEGKICRMHIFKKQNSDASLTALPKAMTTANPMSEEMDYCELAPLQSTTSLPGTSRNFPYRIRLPKRENGYPCRFSDCFKIYHRACDRSKHEQRHGDKGNHPHKCIIEACKKTFLYPKDLKRHERVHERRRSLHSGADEYSNDMSDASSYSEAPSLVVSTASAASTPSSFLSDSVSEDEADLTPMPKVVTTWSDGQQERASGMDMYNGWPFEFFRSSFN